MNTAWFAQTALLVMLVCFMGGGKYYPSWYLFDAAIVMLLAGLFLASLKLELSREEWRKWLLLPLAAVLAFIVAYSCIFHFNTGLPVLPSIAAGRWLLLWLFAPFIYFLYKSGVSIATIENIFYVSLMVLAVNYLFVYGTVDLMALADSADDPAAKSIVAGSVNDWKGVRLKGPDSPAWPLLLMISYMKLRNREAGTLLHGLVFLSSLGLIIWSKDRLFPVCLLGALLTYLLLTRTAARKTWLLFVTTAALIATVLLLPLLTAYLEVYVGGDMSYLVRIQGYMTAIEAVAEKSLFGYGIASYHTQSYSDLFGEQFYTADLGIVGVYLMFGFIGSALYLAVNIGVVVKVFRHCSGNAAAFNMQSPVMTGLCVLFIAMTYSLSMQAWFSLSGGIVLAAFALGLIACHEDSWKLT